MECSRNEEGLVRKLVGRPRRRWLDNVKMDLGEVGWGGVDWIDLAQDSDQRALVNSVMNLRVPENVGKSFIGCTTGSFSRSVPLREVNFAFRSSRYNFVDVSVGRGADVEQ
jgi:hypothetical protein